MHNLRRDNLRNVYDAMRQWSDNIPCRTLHSKSVEIAAPRQLHMSACPRCFGRKSTVFGTGGAGSPISTVSEIVAHFFRSPFPATDTRNRSILHFGTDFTAEVPA